jgi:endonuclease/exonuclease/phosphatase family metal-dependent hydrolase
MPTPLRIATFNLENLDDRPGLRPPLAVRIATMRPQLERLRADILCLQEINGQEVLQQPRDLLALRQLVASTRYEAFHQSTTLTAEAQPYDERNLVVLSRFPITGRRQLQNDEGAPAYRKVTAMPPEPDASPVRWERPILYVTVTVGDRTLHVINVHLKSKIPTAVRGQGDGRGPWRTVPGWAEGFFLSSMKRVGQALEIRMLVDTIFDAEPEAWIAVCGDFNADCEDVPLSAIRGPVEETVNPALASRVLVACENTIPTSARYSLLHLGRGYMLDHVLVSRPLLAFYRHAEIHNEMLPDESGAFRTDVLFPESDHAPVVAEFEVP